MLLAAMNANNTTPARVNNKAVLAPVLGSCAPVLFSTGTSGEVNLSVFVTVIGLPLYVYVTV